MSVFQPYDSEYDYLKEVQELDVDSVIKDLKELMRNSQDWWPADFGPYGPLFIPFRSTVLGVIESTMAGVERGIEA